MLKQSISTAALNKGVNGTFWAPHFCCWLRQFSSKNTPPKTPITPALALKRISYVRDMVYKHLLFIVPMFALYWWCALIYDFYFHLRYGPFEEQVGVLSSLSEVRSSSNEFLSFSASIEFDGAIETTENAFLGKYVGAVCSEKKCYFYDKDYYALVGSQIKVYVSDRGDFFIGKNGALFKWILGFLTLATILLVANLRQPSGKYQ